MHYSLLNVLMQSENLSLGIKIPLPKYLITISIIFYQHKGILEGYLATPQGMWDLSSSVRDGTRMPCKGSTES